MILFLYGITPLIQHENKYKEINMVFPTLSH